LIPRVPLETNQEGLNKAAGGIFQQFRYGYLNVIM
jgi:hypothetical protein